MKTLFLYITPAPTHRKLAESMGAEFKYAYPWKGKKFLKPIKLLYFTLTMPKRYDIYLCEGSTYLFPALAKKLGLIHGKVIMIAADPLFHYIKRGLITGISKTIYKNLLNYVDIFLCASKFVKEDLKSLILDANAIVMYPLIDKNKKIILKRYSKIIPNLNSKRIIFIGRPDIYYKGIDLLIDSFLKIKEIYPEAELTLVGNFNKDSILEYESKAAIKMPPKKISYIIKKINGKGITILKDLSNIDFVKALKSSSLYLHLGRGDAFVLAVEEAMLSGLPAIVSDETGSKEFVEILDKRFVVKMEKDEIVKAVVDYFSCPYKKKLALSKKALLISQKFSSNSEKNFRKTLDNILSNK